MIAPRALVAIWLVPARRSPAGLSLPFIALLQLSLRVERKGPKARSTVDPLKRKRTQNIFCACPKASSKKIILSTFEHTELIGVSGDGIMAPHIQAATVEAALERILLSSALSGSRALCRLLEYIVRRTLVGEGDQIKEYTIGVDVFGRGTGFNPRCDPIVRVEAFSLRQKLERYYRSEGLHESVQITVPKGGYRPIFRVRDDLQTIRFEDPESVCWMAKSLLFRSTPQALEHAEHCILKAIEQWPTR